MKEITKEWLLKSAKDYRLARKLFKEADNDTFEAICFFCQQCIEKLIKAILIHHNKTFPKTHNLKDLNNLLLEVIPLWEVRIADLQILTRGATEFRYPGEDATLEDATQAMEICENLKQQLSKLILE